MQLSFSGGTNRMDGYSYDAAGNLLSDGTHSYAYDAENRLSKVDNGSTAAYIYDAEGQRVRKTTGGISVDYLYDLAGNEITELSSAGAWNRGEVYAGGRHLATYQNGAGGATYLIHSDWLGTERVRTNSAGALCETIISLPFGDAQTTSGSCGDPSPMHFTGKERDTESGLDYLGARHYSSALGRFMQPDEFPGGPVDLFDVDDPASQALPYADITDPQSLNKYGYTYNNPLRSTDPDGHCPWCITAAIGAAAGFTASMVVQKWQHPDQAINWKSVGAATLGGAVASATLGLAAPATLTTLGGTAVVSTAGVGETVAVGAASGVAGGIAERTVENDGDVNRAMENPNAMVRDAAVGTGGEMLNKTVGSVVEHAAGGAARTAEANVQRLTSKSPANLVTKRMGRLDRAQSALEKQQTKADLATRTAVAAADKKTTKKK